jgi:predicted RNA-binding protein with PIN domain
MGATYVIDGYNLLHAMGLLSGRAGPGVLETARTRLASLVAGAFGSDAATVTVVFDAAKAVAVDNPEQHLRGVHVLFAVGKQEADDVIERLIRQSSAPKSLHVVSNDHRIQRAARRRHCVALGCEDFLRALEKMRAARRQAPGEPPEKQEGLSDAEKQLWLAEFGDLEKDPTLKKAFEKYDFEVE